MERPASLLRRLRDRELGPRRPGTSRLRTRGFYEHILPNYMVHDVHTPNVIFRRFTPDGRYLIAFSRNQQDLLLYRFKGREQHVAELGERLLDQPMMSSAPSESSSTGATVATDATVGGTGGAISGSASGPVPASGGAASAVSGSSAMPSGLGLSHAMRGLLSADSSANGNGAAGGAGIGVGGGSGYASGNEASLPNGHAPHQVFSSYFDLHYERHITSCTQLCKDFSLVTANEQYLILASVGKVPAGTPSVSYRNPDSVGIIQQLGDYILHLIRIDDGMEVDRRVFVDDFIHLHHHQGVYLYNDMLSVLSLQNQTIHVFQIKSSGSFNEVHRIGYHCYEDDALVLAQQREFEANFRARKRAMDLRTGKASARELEMLPDEHQPFFTGLRHRFLVHLFKKAKAQGPPKLRVFFENMHLLPKLTLHKCQFLDEQHLLIKLGTQEAMSVPKPAHVAESASGHNNIGFFVVYNLLTTELIAAYENYSEEFYMIFERFAEQFRNSGTDMHGRVVSTFSNTPVIRDSLRRHKLQMTNAKNGGRHQAVKRVLAPLPYNCQAYSDSPYLDQSLFKYDEKLISASDRPKPCSEFPIKFSSQATGKVRFKLMPGCPPRVPGSRVKRISSYIFHPYLPFVMSMQLCLLHPTIVSFHYYRDIPRPPPRLPSVHLGSVVPADQQQSLRAGDAFGYDRARSDVPYMMPGEPSVPPQYLLSTQQQQQIQHQQQQQQQQQQQHPHHHPYMDGSGVDVADGLSASPRSMVSRLPTSGMRRRRVGQDPGSLRTRHPRC